MINPTLRRSKIVKHDKIKLSIPLNSNMGTSVHILKCMMCFSIIFLTVSKVFFDKNKVVGYLNHQKIGTRTGR